MGTALMVGAWTGPITRFGRTTPPGFEPQFGKNAEHNRLHAQTPTVRKLEKYLVRKTEKSNASS